MRSVKKEIEILSKQPNKDIWKALVILGEAVDDLRDSKQGE